MPHSTDYKSDGGTCSGCTGTCAYPPLTTHLHKLEEARVSELPLDEVLIPLTRNEVVVRLDASQVVL